MDDEPFQTLIEQVRDLHRRTDELNRSKALRTHEHIRARLTWNAPLSLPPISETSRRRSSRRSAHPGSPPRDPPAVGALLRQVGRAARIALKVSAGDYRSPGRLSGDGGPPALVSSDDRRCSRWPSSPSPNLSFAQSSTTDSEFRWLVAAETGRPGRSTVKRRFAHPPRASTNPGRHTRKAASRRFRCG